MIEPTSISRYIYDNEDILLELDGSNNITARYTHGPGIDEPLVMEKGGQSYFYHADDLGSITELTDASGVVAQRYTYSSFGKIESTLDPIFVQPFTFTARELDPETGLYHYRARYYEAATGRFTQEDPIGFMSGSLNLFTYANSDPVTFIDPTGLATFIGCRPVRGTRETFQHCFIRILPEPGTRLEKLAKRLGQESITLSLLTENTGFGPYDIAAKVVNGEADLDFPTPFRVRVPKDSSLCEFDEAVFNQFLQHPNTVPYDNNPWGGIHNSNTFIRRIIEGAGGQLPEGLPNNTPGLRR